MNVLMISIDKALLGDGRSGDAVERHKKYGEFLDNLDIVVYANKNEGFSKNIISQKVRAWPSASFCKPFLLFDVFRIFNKIKKVHEIDLVVCQDSCYLGFVGLLLKWRYKTKLIVDFHGDLWDNPFWIKEKLVNRFFILLSRFVVKRADGIRSVSRRIKEKLVRYGIKESSVEVIHAAVNTEVFDNLDSNKVESIKDSFDGNKIILFVGRLVPVKNIPLLLRSFSIVKSRYKNVSLLIIGDGPQRKFIEVLVSSLGLGESVSLVGEVQLRDISNYYHAADFFVLSSFSEGLPRVLVEAGSCGLPLVSTDVSGAEDVIENGKNGFLVPVNNEELLAKKMLFLLQDDEVRMKMGEQAQRMIKSKDFGDTTKKLTDFWNDVFKKA